MISTGYNYFMVIGVVEGYAGYNYIKVKVEREFGQGEDHFEIRLPMDNWDNTIFQNLKMGSKIIVKGRLVQTENKLEMLAERITF